MFMLLWLAQEVAAVLLIIAEMLQVVNVVLLFLPGLVYIVL